MSQDQSDLFGAIGAQARISAGAGLVPVPAAAIPTKRLRAGGVDPDAVRSAYVAPSGAAWLEHEIDRLTRKHARFNAPGIVAHPSHPSRISSPFRLRSHLTNSPSDNLQDNARFDFQKSLDTLAIHRRADDLTVSDNTPDRVAIQTGLTTCSTMKCRH
ncbi:MAG: hypothetical protein NTV93_16850 [Verrucomicrobia bacterium]|nr:hypothetical protein [Verrucomicrobiota bacterium]